MKYKLVIFDMDGTILNTLEDIADALNYILELNHLPTRTYEQVKSYVGNGARVLVCKALDDADKVDEILQQYTPYYAAHCSNKTAEYPGVSELLKWLRENGVRTAVVSNKQDVVVQPVAKKHFDGLFDIALGEREGIRKKPYPDSILEVCRQLNIGIDEAVYIGDSEVDIEASHNAKMDSIIVSYGFRNKTFLKECGAINIADTVEEIKNYL